MSIGGATDALSRGVPDDVLDAKARGEPRTLRKYTTSVILELTYA